jgi:hypothetical protein
MLEVFLSDSVQGGEKLCFDKFGREREREMTSHSRLTTNDRGSQPLPTPETLATANAATMKTWERTKRIVGSNSLQE